MDVAILGDTIGEIVKGIPSHTTTSSRTGLSSTDSKKLEEHLTQIQVVVQREMQYHAQGEVLEWLRELKGAVNDLNDLVEEFSTIDSRQESTPFYLFKSNPSRDRLKLTHKTKKVIEELQGVVSKAKDLPPSAETMKKGRKLEKLGPEFELEAVGREKVKKEIIDQLQNRSIVPVPVVTIVGVAGIGKTKLARLVYKDEDVQKHVGYPISVPNTIGVDSIAEFVINSDAADKKRFIILDDLRVEIRDEDISALQHKLKEAGLSVGAILITTRSSLVAASSVKSYALQGLNEDESWDLFKATWNRFAAGSVEPHALQGPNEDIRTKIVGQCRGVPLAIITMSRLFLSRRSQGTQVEAEEVAELTKEFLQELAFSYYDEQLSTHRHKLCFAYCSLFPKDYVIDVERLIHLWMGEGFLGRPSDPPQSELNLEGIGREYFSHFLGWSIFQDLKGDGCDDVRSCRMHPLMHDIARFVTDQEENITVDPDGHNVKEGVLRASFDFSLDVSGGIPASLFVKAKKLRTILLLAKTESRLPQELKMSTSTCAKIFDSFKSLRMLDLHDLGLKTVSSSIGELKNLRYLDLSLNNMEKLPGSITKLSHLQTLKLSHCHLLKELPKNFEDLISLRHLDTEGCLGLTHMPRKINKLSSLQTLSLFVACKNYHMGGLGELASLDNLRGHLEILHLERVKFPASKDGFLKKKQHLLRLTLRWDQEDDQVKNFDNKLLECLEPCSNLKVLFVVGYNGDKFSNWLSSIRCLVKLSLNNCPKFEFLPQLDQLPLRFLELRRLDSLEFIAENCDNSSADTADRINEIEGTSSSISNKCPPFFQYLKELIISDCPKLRSWWREEKRENDRQSFACISKLNIQSCPMLDCMPLYPHLDEELVLVESSVRSMRDTMRAKTSEGFVPFSKLKSMVIARVEHSPPESWLKNFTSLENLHIRECFHLKSLPQGFQSLSSLQHLTIERCPELDLDHSKTEWEGLKDLLSLTIREIPKLKSLPLGVDSLTSLQILGLYHCPGLASLPESIGNLKSLGRLVISKCPDLTSLPKGMENLNSLNTLIILDCAFLLPRCQPKTGDDWPQIAHIPNIQVKETSQDF